MVDFRKHMTQEQRDAHDAEQARTLKEREKMARYSDVELARYAQHIYDNCEAPHRLPIDTLTYDTAMWRLVLPELIARLAGAVSVRGPQQALTPDQRLQAALEELRRMPLPPK